MEPLMLIAHILKEKGGDVHTITEEATLCDAARELTSKRVGAIVVLNGAGKIAGVLSERDIVR